eukprot:CAMPEP_0206019526 /NCGR_PEP_ID=MMETSP1464-20131121/29257_1 /ASSEMBLY_ACC=CAM_ASM_001124 /TAXON_ID=119497 /ORGANISM="Exanthemachrysis gayraliae, Strain RCC1523" /LENGTH=36 /DNA_ID= /DNA_START= /DNA_END= /DNA_ORIENTATION=
MSACHNHGIRREYPAKMMADHTPTTWTAQHGAGGTE